MKKLLLTLLCISTLSFWHANAQLTEGFESGVFPPTNWTQEYVSAAVDWSTSNGNANGSIGSSNSGSLNAIFVANNYSGNSTRLVTPTLDLSAGASYDLSFYHSQVDWGGDQDVLTVYYKTSSTGAWVELANYPSALYSWTQRTITLPNISGDYYIAFQGTSGYGRGVTLDDVAVALTPNCADASAAMSAITATGATATWDAANGAASYDWEVVPSGNAQGVGVVASGSGETGLTVSITGLTSNTTYDFLISSDCTTDYASAVTFTTSVAPYVGCGDTDYDTGGPNGNYSANEDYTITYTPDTPGDIVTIDIDYVQIEANWDFLSVYDGADITATQLSAAVTADVSYTASSGDGLTIRFTSDGSGQYAGWSLTSSCAAPPACENPSAAISAITATGATATWDAANGAASYDWEVVPSGNAQGVGVVASGSGETGLTVSITGLTANTAYDFLISSDCITDYASAVSFTTLCGTFSLPFSEGMDNAGSTPDCWTQSGAENWLFGTSGPNHVGNGGVISGNTESNGYYAVVDASGTEANAILTSPSVDISSLTSPMLTFYELSDNEGGANSLLTVEVYDGAAWNTVRTFDSNTLNNAWEQKEVSLDGLTFTGNAQVRFTFTEPTSSDFYDDIAIDDVSFIETPLCSNPAAAMSAITQTTATATWSSANGAVSYDWEVVPTGSAQGTGVVASGSGETGFTASITGLTANTGYDFLISSDCTTDYASAVTFTTSVAPYVGCGDTDYDTGGPNGNYSANEDYTITYTPDTPGDIVTIDIDYVQIEANWDFLSVYDGADINATQLSAAVTADVSYTASSGDGLTIRFTSDGSGQYAGYSLTSSCAAPPSCDAITGFAVDSFTASTAELSWTETTATSYNVEYGVTGFTQGTGTTSSETGGTASLSLLDSATSYDVYVQGNCDGDVGPWNGPVTFTTLPGCGDTVSFCYSSGATVKQSELESSGDYITATVNSGSTESNWDFLIIYDSLDASGTVLYNASGDHTGVSVTSTTGLISAWVNADGSVDCGGSASITEISMTYTCAAPPACVVPTDLTVDSFTETTAEISWTEAGTATDYNVEVYESGADTSTATPVFTTSVSGVTTASVTGLTAATAYDAYVQADCGLTGVSDFTNATLIYTGYCQVSTGSTLVYIDSFTTTGGVTDISNTASGYSTGGYGDFTAQSISGLYGTQSFDVAVSSPQYGGSYHFWVDWDNNLSFDNTSGSTEFVGTIGEVLSGTITVTIPAGQAAGDYRLRAVLNNSTTAAPDPCLSFTYGEFEDYTVSVVVTPACTDVSNISLTSFTETTADLSWTENGVASNYNLELYASGADQTTETPLQSETINGSTTASLSGLTPYTMYDVYIQTNCGLSGTADFVSYTFRTGHCAPSSDNTIVYINDVTTTGGTLNISNNASGFSTGGYGDFRTQSVSGYATQSFDMAFNNDGTYGGKMYAWVDWNDDLTFDNTTGSSEIVYIADDVNYASGSFTVSIPDGQAIGDYVLRIKVQQVSDGNPCGDMVYGEVEDYTVSVTETPSCLVPDTLASSNITSVSADLSWNETGSATSHVVYVYDTGADPTTATPVYTENISGSTTATATGLSSASTYDFYVTAVCAQGLGTIESNLQGTPHTFTTLPGCGDTVTFCYSSGATVKQAELESSGNFITATVNSGSTESGWDNLIIYDSLDASGTVLYNASGDHTGVSVTSTTGLISAWVNADGSVDCGSSASITEISMTFTCAAPPACLSPTSLSASGVTSTTADLDWTAGDSETLWDIELVDVTAGGSATGTPTTDDVSTNPYTLSGLTSGNDYEVYLRADCSGDNSDTSDWISVSFSTLPGCGDTVSFCYAGGLVKHTELESLGDLVTVTVNSGSTESGYDDLVIFDSLDTSGNVLYNTDGDHTGVTITSTTGLISVWTNADGSWDCDDGQAGSIIEVTFSCVSPCNWTGAASSDWTDVSNWSTGAVPTSSDIVIIDGTFTNEPSISSSTDAAAISVSVATGNTLTIDETSSLTVSGDFTNSGTVTLNSTEDDFSSLIVTGTATGDIVYNRFVNVYDDTAGGGWDLV